MIPYTAHHRDVQPGEAVMCEDVKLVIQYVLRKVMDGVIGTS